MTSISRAPRPVLLALALALPLLLTVGCGGQGAPGSNQQAAAGVPKMGGTFVAAFEADTGPFNVDVTGGIVSSRALRHVYEPLLSRNFEDYAETPPVRGMLAEKWDMSPDGLTYTLNLRKGVKFQDGTPWNAAAAKYTFDRLLDQNHPSYNAAAAAAQRRRTGVIKAVTAVDDSTLKVEMKDVNVEFLVDTESIFMVSPDLLRKQGMDNYVRAGGGGTGPFKLAKYENGVEAVLERNPDYWGKQMLGGGPYLDKIVIRFLVEPTARIAALLAGEVDWIAVVPPDNIPQLQTDKRFVLGMDTIPHTWGWIMNFKNEFGKQDKLRQAMALSIDRDRMVKDLLRGSAEPAYRFWAPGSAGYRATQKDWTYGYDPERAKSLLREAGYPNGIDIKVLTPNSGSGLMVPGPMNEYIQAEMVKVGIRVKYDTLEWQTFFAKWRAGFEPEYVAYVQAYPTENVTSLRGWTHTLSQPPAATNGGWYSNAEVDKLLDEGQRTVDQAKRYELYNKAVDLTARDVFVLDVVHDKAPLAWSKKVQGFVHPKSWSFVFYKTWLSE